MRLHANDFEGDDPVKADLALNADVYLDGVKQTLAIMADEEKGELERFKRNEDGTFVHAGDELATEIVHGKVEIVDPRVTK